MNGQAIYTQPPVTSDGLSKAMSDAVKDARKAIPVRFSVQANLLSIGDVPVWGMVADRDLTVLGVVFRLASLTGVSVNLKLSLRKNGVTVSGGAFTLTPTTLGQSADYSISLVKGDLLTLDRMGLSALATAGILCGYVSVT